MTIQSNTVKRKKVIHTITIKLKTEKGYLTNTLWERLVKLMRKDDLFTDKNFDSIQVMGKNNLE